MAHWVSTQGQANLAEYMKTSPDCDVSHRESPLQQMLAWYDMQCS